MSGFATDLGSGNDTWPGAAFPGQTNSLADTIDGQNGNDSIDGGAGNDLLIGGAGNDSLRGGNDDDTLDGGSGNDWASYVTATYAVTVNLEIGSSSGAGGNDSLTGIENILGSNRSDSILGDSLNNLLDGRAGFDSIEGGAGNDTLLTQEWASGDWGRLSGGEGNDSLYAQGDYFTLEGGAGRDTLYGSRFVLGGADDDRILQNSSSNVTLNGEDGNDTLIGAGGGVGGHDIFLGGAGNDSVALDSLSSQTVYGETGNDTLVSGTEPHQFFSGGDGEDSIVNIGNFAVAHTLDGGAGNDTLIDLPAGRWIHGNIDYVHVYGGTGNDSIQGLTISRHYFSGGDGNDTAIAGDSANDSIDGGLGDDSLSGGTSSNADWLFFSSSTSVTVDFTAGRSFGDGTDSFNGFEAVQGSNADDSILGGNGNETFDGAGGDDTLVGGAGSDWVSFASATGGITVNLGTSSSAGAAGIDSLTGIEAALGGNYGDVLIAGPNGSMLNSGSGNDTLIGGAGIDTLIGGADNGDLLNYASETANITVNLNGAATSSSGGIDSITGIEAVNSGSGNDSILGAASNETISGGGGNDTLVGGNGDDWLSYALATGGITVNLGTGSSNGEYGQDSITGFEAILGGSNDDLLIAGDGGSTLGGGLGNDTLVGGNSSDWVSYTEASGAITLDLGADSFSTDSLTGIENILGSSGNDCILGNSVANILHGGAGADTLVGLTGNDTLIGGSENDWVSYATATASVTVNFDSGRSAGLHGNDSLTGVEGILGGTGDDSLGGSFYEDSTVQGGLGNDTIFSTFISYADASGSVTVDLNAGTSSGADGEDILDLTLIWYRGFASGIIGSGYADSLSEAGDVGYFYASFNGNTGLYGGGGNDTLIAADYVQYRSYSGGDDDDRLRGSLYYGYANRFSGDAGNDTIITASEFESLFYGGNGDDSILNEADEYTNSSYINTVYGEAGNDTLVDGSAYNSQFYGGDGEDSLQSFFLAGLGGYNSFYGDAGNDTLVSISGTNDRPTYLSGGADNDSLLGNSADNALSGDAGDDTLAGGEGNDTLDGGADNDFASYADATGAITVNLRVGSSSGQHGEDSLTGIENILGGNGDDSIVGDSLANLLDGGGGLDFVSYANAGGDVIVDLGAMRGYGDGTDTLSGIENILGGNGNDSILGDSLANVLNGGNGDDTLVGSNGDDTLYGGNGVDVGDFRGFGTNVTVDLVQGLVFDEGGTTRFFDIERILTEGGQATLERGAGGDTFSGGEANDLVVADAGNDEISGDLGDDTFDGGNGNDQISGGDGDDSIAGGIGNDCLEGGGLNDTFQGGPGDDTFIGGAGRDLVDYAYVTGHGVTVSLADETAYGGSEDVLSGIEDVSGSNQDDVLTGDVNDNLINGLIGNDLIRGLAGNDTLDGGDGNDTLQGGLGDDRLEGGDGTDFASYADASTGVDANIGSGNAIDGANNDLLFGIEGLIGSNHNDTLTGGDGVDSLSGGAGNDWLDFGAGVENYLRGPSETGNDTLIGGLGNDTLDLESDWSFLSSSGSYSIYRDGSDTIWAQDWEQVVCFAEGTRIVTPNGEDAVENLRAGDMVLAMRGGQAGFEALRWVGFMDVAVPRNAAMATKTAPILIKAGTIAPGMPARDLRVSPDHAMEVDGHLIPAKHLVNGSSIIQEVWCKRVRYFHLELEAHGLLLSEGTWSESYLDDGNRHAFNNTALTGLFLDFEAGRSQGQYDQLACLPVLRQGLKLDEIHGRLALRAEDLALGGRRRLRR